MARMTGAQITLETLQREGVDTIFGYPGGVVLPLYDTFPQFPGLRHVLVRHEQGAATWPTATPARAARWASAWRPAVPARPTSSPASAPR